MRKILAVLFFLPLTAVLFAQNAEYKSLLAKAKQYESQKRFAYALGTYYDALNADPENSEEAMKGYENLCTLFQSGKPGTGEYSEFALYDGWKALLEDAEIYWTEHAAEIDFINFKIVRNSLNYSKRTGNYTLGPYFNGRTEKFNNFISVLQKGLAREYREDWKGIPEDWPEKSVFPPYSTYAKTKAAVYTEGKFYGEWRGRESCEKEEVFPCWYSRVGAYKYNSYNNFGYNGIETSLFDIKFVISDLNGNVLFKSNRFLIGQENISLELSQEKMNLIDKGEYEIKITDMMLQSGDFQWKSNVFWMDGDWLENKGFDSFRSFVKNLTDVKVDLKYNNKDSVLEYCHALPDIKKVVETVDFEKGIAKIDSQSIGGVFRDYGMFEGYTSRLKYGYSSAKFCDFMTKARIGKNECVFDYEKLSGNNHSYSYYKETLTKLAAETKKKGYRLQERPEGYVEVFRPLNENDYKFAILEAKNAGDWLRLRSLFDDAVSKNYAVTLADFELDEKTLDENVFMSRVNLELVKENYAGAKEILREAREKNVEVNFTESQVDEAECRKSIEKSVAARSWEYVHSLLEDAKQKNYAFTISDFGLTDEELDSRRKEPYIAKMKQGLRTENFESVEEAISDARKKNLDVTFASVGLTEYKFEELKADKAEREKHFAIAAFRKKITEAFLAKNFEDAKSQYDMAVERGFTKEELALDPKILKKLKIK